MPGRFYPDICSLRRPFSILGMEARSLIPRLSCGDDNSTIMIKNTQELNALLQQAWVSQNLKQSTLNMKAASTRSQ